MNTKNHPETVGPPVTESGRPQTPKQLHDWIRAYTGIEIPSQSVCAGHQSPWDCFRTIHLDRPSIALVLGSRGCGKSFLSALDTHITSRWNPGHGTRILGGSKAQSEQIYRALREIATQYEGTNGNDAAAIARLRKDGASYVNGSEVAILAASSTSVRGPHVASLKLDEVDEIDVDLRESAMGMCMALSPRGERGKGLRASALMTSTCHRVNGPMAQLVERAREGEFPLFTMCVFEVLETCPAERSGPGLERCPECPIVRWCHSEFVDGLPKAKRSQGHYTIDSLIQKAKTTGIRTFEADYLCKLSGSDSAWFPEFDPARHVSERAEFIPGFDVHLAVDSGVFTGAVFFQVIPPADGRSETGETIHVFADYLAEGRSAEANAREIVRLSESVCLGRRDRASTDPAGNSRTAIGPTVLAEYRRAGLELQPWPLGKVADGLALLESFINPAGPDVRFLVHPRCVAMIRALQSYRRAKRAGDYLDYPADPQHPHEDLVDALRGGLKAAFPEGRIPKPSYRRVSASKAF
ncbi:hypothetical protein TA3x_002276 [Tundrisphaera sp. TA3]|uniref:hypothetical protein n=1 Tax=Tundrisphaera sp. TA3 TaxID=3435775 RepID=UPI003EBA7028